MPRTNPRVTWLSPAHRSDKISRPVSFDDKVAIFQAKLTGWQLTVADECANGINGQPADPHAGFAGLHLCLSYFETIAKYQTGYVGDFESKKHFKLGLLSVFPNLKRAPASIFDKRAEFLYKAGRCGLYHASQTSRGILLASPPTALRFSPTRNLVLVNPSLLPRVLKRHLDFYCARLLRLRNHVLRDKFVQRFNHDNPGLA